MKKWLIIIGISMLCATVVIYTNKLYYPSLPISSVTKKEALKRANANSIALLQQTEQEQWYIIHASDQAAVDEIMMSEMLQLGWEFKTKEGAGLFFKKDTDETIVTTQKWTNAYSLIKVER